MPMDYKTLNVKFKNSVCFIQFNRPEAKNTINSLMIRECHEVLRICEEAAIVVVFEGSPEFFCFGADFEGVHSEVREPGDADYNPGALYDLWAEMATGSFVTVSHVRGQANAGGLGFVAASDIVIASDTATFSLSELLFGLFPAMVLPFLIRKMGHQRANYLTLMTKPISVRQSYEWGLVDAYQEKSESLLRQHLARLIRLPKSGIKQYKGYMTRLNPAITASKELAVEANLEIFSDPSNLQKISRFVEKGIYPWED